MGRCNQEGVDERSKEIGVKAGDRERKECKRLIRCDNCSKLLVHICEDVDQGQVHL
jgi:hypothetical protein